MSLINAPDPHLGPSTCRDRRSSLLLFYNFKPNLKKKSVSHSSDPPGSLPGGGRGPFLLEGGFFIMKLLSLGDWLRVGGSSLPHTMCFPRLSSTSGVLLSY